jgi:hypothetical protein
MCIDKAPCCSSTVWATCVWITGAGLGLPSRPSGYCVAVTQATEFLVDSG